VTRIVTLLLLAVSLAAPLSAQSGQVASQRLSVFLDCHADCDFDLIREEIAYVEWLRDRTGSDVHLLITSLDAGAGGTAFTVEFLGQGRMAGRGDTLRFTTSPTATDDEERRALVRIVAAGLAPFVARSGHADLLRITAAQARADRKAAPATRDPWRAWVFEVGVSGGFDGEALYKNSEINGGLEARRVTDAWKFNFEFDYEYEDERVTDQEFDTQGNVVSEETFRNLQRSWSADYLLVKSLTGHASAGFLGNIESNTFRNLSRAVEAGPAIEYNVFPYTQSTRRELVFRYSLAYEHNRYVDTTIFDRVSESLPLHVGVMNYRTQAPWGSMSFRVEHRNYLMDAAKRNTDINGSFDVRLLKGLELEMSGGYSWIRDQIALRKGGGDQVDVLLRRRELLTGYNYYGNVGLSYTFGSIFSTVVNPRF
jgi:hypothetical protein